MCIYIYVCRCAYDISIIFFAMFFFALVCYFLELLRLFRCFTCTYLDMCFFDLFICIVESCLFLLQVFCFLFFHQQRKLMGSSAQNSSGVHWCRRRVRFNQVPETVPKAPEKGWEGGLGGFGAEPAQVQQGSGEGPGEGSGEGSRKP